jgi:hypothetical protein
MKIYVAAAKEALRRRKHSMKLSLLSKLVEKLVWVLVSSFGKIFIPSYAFDALFCRNWPFSPPNFLTLWITLLIKNKLNFFGKNFLFNLNAQAPSNL